MGASNSENSKTNFFSLKAKTSDSDPSPFFGKNVKTGNGWGISEKFNSMDGNLVEIKHSTYDYQGETKHKCELTLKDADGTRNVVGSNFNNLLYSLLNALSNCEPGLIAMNLSLGKAKIVDGKETKRYPSIWLKNNGQDVKWKYDPDKQPKNKKVKVAGKVVIDDAEVIEFWAKVIESEIKPKLKAEIKAEVLVSASMDAPDSDLPF